MRTAQLVWIAIVCSLGVLIVQFGFALMYVAGPDIARDTGATQTELTWIVDVYTLAIAGVLLPAGAVADRFGRRGVMTAGFGLFVVTVLPALVVDTPELLIGARAVNGVAAGLILPSTLSLITTLFPPERRDLGIAVWTVGFLSGGATGVVSGGVLLEFFEWRSVFWLLLGMAVLGVLVSPTIPTSRDEDSPPFDLAGSVTGGVSITLVTFGLIEAGNRGWTDPLVLAIIGAGVLIGALFVGVELRADHPMLDVRLLRIRAFGASAFVITFVFVATFGMYYVTIIYLQYILGYSALAAAIPAIGVGVGTGAIAFSSATLTRRFGLNTVLAVGFLCAAGGFAVFYQAGTGDSGYWVIVGGMLVFGFGIGAGQTPCTAAIVDHVPPEKQGVAAAVNHTTREVGTALGVALFGSILASGYRSEISDATADLPPPARDVARDSLPGAQGVAAQLGPDGAALETAARDAFISGMHLTFLVVGILTLVCAVLAFCWAPGPVRAGRRGRVLGTSDHPVANARITVLDLDGHQVALTRSDVDGDYLLPALKRGSHLVVCAAPGMEPQAAMLRDGSPDDTWSFRLRPDPPIPARSRPVGPQPVRRGVQLDVEIP